MCVFFELTKRILKDDKQKLKRSANSTVTYGHVYETF